MSLSNVVASTGGARDVALPIAVDSTFKWSEECPDLFAEMLVSGGLLKTTDHVVRAWRDCWQTGEAFRSYRRRLNRSFPYYTYYMGSTALRNFQQALPNGAVAGRYQLDDGHSRARWHPFVVFHDDPHEWLQQRLGPLKAIQIDQPIGSRAVGSE